jgi:hypothetical protein
LSSSDADNIFCAGTSVIFTAGGGTNYNFRVAGSSVQNGTGTTYTTSALTNGQIVDVIVTNASGCSATSAGITNTVNALPTVNAGGAVTAICQSGTTAALGGSFGGGATAAIWSAPSGTFANNTGSTPGTTTFTAAANSTTPITLTLTTSGGSCGTTSANKQVTVNPLPTVSAGGAVTAICQSGTTAALSGSFGGGATSAVWSDGGAGGSFTNNGGSTPNTATYTASVASASPVTLTLTTSGGSCGTTSANKQVTVNPLPTVNAGGAVTAICQSGTTAALGGSFGGGATSAVWSDGGAGGSFTNNGGGTPGSTTYTASATSASPVTLTLTTSGGSCGTTSANKQVTVNLDGSWTGSISTDWNNSGNWACNQLPTATTNVTIPSGTVYSPTTLTGPGVCHSLTVNAGATLSTASSFTLTVSGTTSISGTTQEILPLLLEVESQITAVLSLPVQEFILLILIRKHLPGHLPSQV